MSRVAWLFLTLIFIPYIPVEIQRAASLPDNSPDWCISVWYPSSDAPGGLESIHNNLDLISVINPFWYSPLADGTIQMIDAHSEDADLLTEWRSDGVAIIPTILSNEWRMLADPAVRAFHIDQIVTLVERMSYDGIDIDYEGFPLSARDDFSSFVETLSGALHTRGKLLTIAVHAKSNDAGTWVSAAAQDWTRLAPAVDVFTIMTYDYTSRSQPPGPIAPPEWVRAVLAYAATVTDLNKVRMGLPLYGYSWLRDNPPATTTSWEAAQRLISSFGSEILRDPANEEAYIEVKVRGLPRQTIYFADSIGIDYKLQVVLNDFPDLGGIAIWGIGGEDPAIWDIMRTARSTNCNLKR